MSEYQGAEFMPHVFPMTEREADFHDFRPHQAAFFLLGRQLEKAWVNDRNDTPTQLAEMQEAIKTDMDTLAPQYAINLGGREFMASKPFKQLAERNERPHILLYPEADNL